VTSPSYNLFNNPCSVFRSEPIISSWGCAVRGCRNSRVAVLATPDGRRAVRVAHPLDDRDVLVTACGRICAHRPKINISTVMAGQSLGIKEVGDGIRLVSFLGYDLGYIDLKQRTLQTIDNPFGPRLSPMSRDCHPCLRYNLSPMFSAWTNRDLAVQVVSSKPVSG